MIINHNLGAMNANRNMNINSSNANKSMEKLSSGLRINRAGDDAAGLAISEKMRGQIRGLDQASSNAQDGISLAQTAEGALSETQSILQRMRELATQAGNDTNVTVDRTEIQKEINQLSSEINRIGNTTEFNTQKVLAGDGKVSVAKTGEFTDATLAGGLTTNTEVAQLISTSTAAANGDTLTFTLNGQQIKVTLASSTATQLAGSTSDVTANSVTAYVLSAANTAKATNDALKAALDAVIMKNDTLRGNYTTASTGGATDGFNLKATSSGSFAGAAGNMATITKGGTGTVVLGSYAAAVGTTTYTAATSSINLSAATLTDVLGKGMTINGKAIEFYDGSKGAYTGNAIGIDLAGVANTGTAIVTALVNQAGTKIDGVTLTDTTAGADGVLHVTATQGGEAGNQIKVEDGAINKQFKATLQVGANQGQQLTIDINDMRSIAIGVTSVSGGTDSSTGAKFVSSNSVTNGTDSITREASLDVSSATNATNAIKTINNAIEKVSAERSKLGAFQNRLEHTINNLGTSSENLSSAESRIRDVDMAKEMSTYSKNNILSQAAQAMLAQANQQPQQVLSLLR